MVLKMNPFALSLVALVALAGCRMGLVPKPAALDTIKIGVLCPLGGADPSFFSYGIGIAAGAKLAADHINQGGGVLGKQVELIIQDDAADRSRAQISAQKLVDAGVVAVVGSFASSISRHVLENVMIPARIPLVSPGSTSPALATDLDQGLFFRTIPSDSLQGKALSKVIQTDGHTKITVLYRDNAYGKGLAETLVRDFSEAVGMGSAIAFPYPDTDQQDYQILKKEIQAGSTAVALIGYVGDTSIVLRDWMASHELTDLKWYFEESQKDPAIASNIPDASRIEGMKGTAPFSLGTYLNDFKNAYRTKYGKEALPFSDQAYDATMLIALAMTGAGTATPEGVKNHLPQVSAGGVKQQGFGVTGYQDAVAKLRAGVDLDYEGVSGSVDMNAMGELVEGSYVVWKWLKGQPTDTETVYTFSL